jgi:hypothetical protein
MESSYGTDRQQRETSLPLPRNKPWSVTVICRLSQLIVGRVDIVVIGTCYELDGWGSNSGGGEIF